MNRNNALAQLETLPAAPASGRMFPTAYTNGVPSKWMFRWGNGAPTGTPDAELYIRLDGTSAATKFYGNVNNTTWTVLTVS